MPHFKDRKSILSNDDVLSVLSPKGEASVMSSQKNPHGIDPEFRNHRKGSQLQITKNLLEHEEFIHTIMIAIKPSIFQFRIGKNQIKKYFHSIRDDQPEVVEQVFK